MPPTSFFAESSRELRHEAVKEAAHISPGPLIPRPDDGVIGLEASRWVESIKDEPPEPKEALGSGYG